MTDIRIGNINTTYGDHSPISYTQQASPDPRALLLDLIRAVEQMRDQVGDADRQTADEFLGLTRSLDIASPDQATKNRLRVVLQRVVGVAAMVNQAGIPVIEAARGLKNALGL